MLCHCVTLVCSNYWIKLPITSWSPTFSPSPRSFQDPGLYSKQRPHTQAVSLHAVLFSSDLASLSSIEAGVRAVRIQQAASMGPASLSWGGWLRTRSQGHHSDWLALTGRAVVMVWWGRTADSERERESLVYKYILHIHLLSLTYFLSISVCLLLAFTVLLFTVFISLLLSHTQALCICFTCTETHTPIPTSILFLCQPPSLSQLPSAWEPLYTPRPGSWLASSANQRVTHQLSSGPNNSPKKPSSWSQLTLTSNMERTSLDAACVFGKWEWTR